MYLRQIGDIKSSCLNKKKIDDVAINISDANVL